MSGSYLTPQPPAAHAPAPFLGPTFVRRGEDLVEIRRDPVTRQVLPVPADEPKDPEPRNRRTRLADRARARRHRRAVGTAIRAALRAQDRPS